MSFATAIAIALAAVLACEPAWSIHGQVVEAANSPALRRPVANALVTLRCGGGKAVVVEQSAVADDQGAFALGGLGAGPRLDCELAVQGPGFATLTFPVEQVCADADESQGRCFTAALQAELAPAR